MKEAYVFLYQNFPSILLINNAAYYRVYFKNISRIRPRTIWVPRQTHPRLARNISRNINHLLSSVDFPKNSTSLSNNPARVVATITIPVDETGS